MTDRGILSFIWSHRANRIILLADLLVFILALTTKFFFWDNLVIFPFIVFGLFIPIGLVVTNTLQYSFHAEWARLIKEYKDGFVLKTDVKVYIKNFWPWTELVKIRNTFRAFDIPYYDFNKADILESKDLLIIYGRNEYLFGTFGNPIRTRPFGISLSGNKSDKPGLYQVSLVSKTDAKEFSELTFMDGLYGKDEKITIKIYRTRDENAR